MDLIEKPQFSTHSALEQTLEIRASVTFKKNGLKFSPEHPCFQGAHLQKITSALHSISQWPATKEEEKSDLFSHSDFEKLFCEAIQKNPEKNKSTVELIMFFDPAWFKEPAIQLDLKNIFDDQPSLFTLYRTLIEKTLRQLNGRQISIDVQDMALSDEQIESTYLKLRKLDRLTAQYSGECQAHTDTLLELYRQFPHSEADFDFAWRMYSCTLDTLRLFNPIEPNVWTEKQSQLKQVFCFSGLGDLDEKESSVFSSHLFRLAQIRAIHSMITYFLSVNLGNQGPQCAAMILNHQHTDTTATLYTAKIVNLLKTRTVDAQSVNPENLELLLKYPVTLPELLKTLKNEIKKNPKVVFTQSQLLEHMRRLKNPAPILTLWKAFVAQQKDANLYDESMEKIIISELAGFDEQKGHHSPPRNRCFIL